MVKTKQAKENYIVATNRELAILKNLDKSIEDYSTNENNSETVMLDSEEYFFTSYNGYKNTLGQGKINSLYALTRTIYESIPNDT